MGLLYDWRFHGRDSKFTQHTSTNTLLERVSQYERETEMHVQAYAVPKIAQLQSVSVSGFASCLAAWHDFLGAQVIGEQLQARSCASVIFDLEIYV